MDDNFVGMNYESRSHDLMRKLVHEEEHVEILQVGPRKAGPEPELEEGSCIAPKTAQSPLFLISEWSEPATSLCLIGSIVSVPSGAYPAKI
jgi:hypothetical protein